VWKHPSASDAGLCRRGFLKTGAAFAALVGLGGCSVASASASAGRYGPLRRDPAGIVDLPAGFRYSVLNRLGDRMDDGEPTPPHLDGMAAFAGAGETIVLIRNHELEPWIFDSGVSAPTARRYDRGARSYVRGGTTTLLVSRELTLVRCFPSLAGTVMNCAGGPTPWGSWISCEETLETPETDHRLQRRHGYCFEVPASATGLVAPVPLTAMGRFRHEAIAVDPKTGVVFETEDEPDGCLYRFLPHRAGTLAAGGELQALRLLDFPRGVALTTQVLGTRPHDVDWVTVDNADPGAREISVRVQAVERGATILSRGEGIWWSAPEQAAYIATTTGGSAGTGQILRFAPREGRRGGGTLRIVVESTGRSRGDGFAWPDNISVTPWGDLIVCQDRRGQAYLWTVRGDGEVAPIARNVLNRTEFAGACFSPDGRALFVNIFGTEWQAGLTLAITGPWR
jgi:secreted PhoX family phosphatase